MPMLAASETQTGAVREAVQEGWRVRPPRMVRPGRCLTHRGTSSFETSHAAQVAAILVLRTAVLALNCIVVLRQVRRSG